MQIRELAWTSNGEASTESPDNFDFGHPAGQTKQKIYCMAKACYITQRSQVSEAACNVVTKDSSRSSATDNGGPGSQILHNISTASFVPSQRLKAKMD
jgi:hypothetical protein